MTWPVARHLWGEICRGLSTVAAPYEPRISHDDGGHRPPLQNQQRAKRYEAIHNALFVVGPGTGGTAGGVFAVNGSDALHASPFALAEPVVVDAPLPASSCPRRSCCFLR